MNEIVQEKLKQIPTYPGVYQFFNSEKNIIYIGKAKNLRNRIRSYFQSKKHQRAKTISLVMNFMIICSGDSVSILSILGITIGEIKQEIPPLGLTAS